VVIARLFNTVGPRQTCCYGMVLLSTFVLQAFMGKAHNRVFGDGRQSRYFSYVDEGGARPWPTARRP
jgi:UDP-glucose 4-epimerase